MLNDKMLRGSNFNCFHAGPMKGWTDFKLEPPNAPVPMQGKLFLRNLLGSAGLEMSLNVVPPGQEMPFQHKHQRNAEVYVVVGGQGQFLVDGQCIDVAEGTVLRISPPAARTWRNNIASRTITVVPGITGLIDRLERAGFVHRLRCEKDRRVIYVALTDQGTKTLADLDEPLLALHRKLMGHLSQGDLKDLIRLLEKLREPWTASDE